MFEEKVTEQEKDKAAKSLRDILFFFSAIGLIVVSTIMESTFWFIPFLLGVACLGLSVYDIYSDILYHRLSKKKKRKAKEE
ncbi:MAG: hypothetical protein OEV28_10040 [Nitrospirota bacterium]|nr:hypothetical protein [Nitrospirota bacterium]